MGSSSSAIRSSTRRQARRQARRSTWATRRRPTSSGSTPAGSISRGSSRWCTVCSRSTWSRSSRRAGSPAWCTSAIRPTGSWASFTGALYPPPLEAPWEGRPTAYCGVTISSPAGRALISTLTDGGPAEIRLSHHAAYRERAAHNVVGTIPGREPREVILSAHYDSQAEGPCVYDNGSGLASLLETARALRERQIRHTTVFLASAAEEIGVWGATAQGVGRHRLRTRARARDGGCSRHGHPGRNRQRVPLAPIDLVRRRRAARARGGGGPGPGLGASPCPPRPQHLLRPRPVHRCRRPGLPDLAPRLRVLPLTRRRPLAGRRACDRADRFGIRLAGPPAGHRPGAAAAAGRDAAKQDGRATRSRNVGFALPLSILDAG